MVCVVGDDDDYFLMFFMDDLLVLCYGVLSVMESVDWIFDCE